MEPSVSRLVIIENDIKMLKKKTAIGILEIGDKLLEAKQIVPYGEWDKWLLNNVKLSQRTARNFMRIAQTFSGKDRQALADLDITKLYYLAELSESDRGKLFESNNVKEMTSRELKSVVSTMKADSALMEPLITTEFRNAHKQIMQSTDVLLLQYWYKNILLPYAQIASEIVLLCEARLGELLKEGAEM